jgi:hypothetical protein
MPSIHLRVVGARDGVFGTGFGIFGSASVVIRSCFGRVPFGVSEAVLRIVLGTHARG